MNDFFKEMVESLQGQQEQSVFRSLFDYPLIQIHEDPFVDADKLYLFSRPTSFDLVASPRFVVRLGDFLEDVETPELRCGPHRSPSGGEWAVVKWPRSGKREVVNWPVRFRRRPSVSSVCP